ncbi:DUF3574 domain-containing protein [Aetokthonos hydrillicola Thurmond2011]|jgi:hypothetical protein|uniref:DUF3574 domain-containing protein n=1 Tax=Aetokthonos hydrillicola Thurmond2011 TaxID=2712845 RepID=A0AAP5I5B7_9CYAN|nr:DUF3574 domain-containing protein [Aetokthonos hydrillicola]MBO3458967.1 DUF3574 domain-containing protein [Aetokthonos hydrillicola CCALA 1050]MBW4589074.1 DUF3574 domain-containing protein [Aetokthonos hydrillicola CCALA 1050]MDR9894970.1 DUF3574 domain-containing protein [Aetokthonos hydrillicola Thurmond2011]
MKIKMSRIVVSISLVTALALNCAFVLNVSARRSDVEAFSEQNLCLNQLQGKIFARTELFFGLSKSDGSVVSEEEFQTFINDVVTPLFPDGLTLLTGKGQFKDSSGKVRQEGSKLLILFYPFDQESNRRIQQIRQAYITTFQQESVLRADKQSCVSF